MGAPFVAELGGVYNRRIYFIYEFQICFGKIGSCAAFEALGFPNVRIELKFNRPKSILNPETFVTQTCAQTQQQKARSMKSFEMTIHIFRKSAVLNPEEKPTVEALRHLGFKTVSKIRMGKCHIVTIETDDEDTARQLATDMCKRLLTNPVTESFEIQSIKSVG